MRRPAGALADEMKRAGNLWPQLVSWENLLESARAAARGKTMRPDVARFLFQLEPNLVQLQRELTEGTYVPATYKTFWIRDPKPRMISAAIFRDRVVHHALTRVLEPVFERRFTVDSFASRKGYGQHKALKKAQVGCEVNAYVLKCDIRKYFPSIDRQVLKDLLARTVKCRRTLGLAGLIIDRSNDQEEAVAYFPGDDLFTPFERARGLPIGNQCSQFFANVYLNALDHYVARELRPERYIRYVDDMLLFGGSKEALTGMRARLVDFLGQLRLRLHDGKSRVYLCRDGIPFLGWRLSPTGPRLARANVVRARRRLKWMGREFDAGRMDFKSVQARVRAWIGHAMWGNTLRLRREVLGKFVLGAVRASQEEDWYPLPAPAGIRTGRPGCPW